MFINQVSLALSTSFTSTDKFCICDWMDTYPPQRATLELDKKVKKVGESGDRGEEREDG